MAYTHHSPSGLGSASSEEEEKEQEEAGRAELSLLSWPLRPASSCWLWGPLWSSPSIPQDLRPRFRPPSSGRHRGGLSQSLEILPSPYSSLKCGGPALSPPCHSPAPSLYPGAFLTASAAEPPQLAGIPRGGVPDEAQLPWAAFPGCMGSSSLSQMVDAQSPPPSAPHFVSPALWAQGLINNSIQPENQNLLS